jgi:hypothetical protein
MARYKRNHEADIEAFLENINVKPNGCYLWTGSVSPNGYGITQADGRPIAAHRLAWELFNGSIPDDLCVLHRCDDRLCVNVPEHLFLGTKRDNTQDMLLKGRAYNGADHQRRVSDVEKMNMCQRRVDGASWYRIGKEFGRAQQHVQGIVTKYFAMEKKPVGSAAMAPVDQDLAVA